MEGPHVGAKTKPQTCDNAEGMMLIAVHGVVDAAPYVDGNAAAAQIAQSSTLLHLERNPVVERRKKSTC